MQAVVVIAGLVAMASFAGCAADLSKPACGWSSNIPANGTAVCNKTYATLNLIAHAELSGSNRVIRQYVTSPSVARRVIKYGRELRRHDLQFLRVSPDPELAVSGKGQFTVALYIVGKDNQGSIDESDTVTEKVSGRSVRVIADAYAQQQQSW